MIKLNLPFTDQKGGNKNSFKILNNIEINNKMKKTNIISFVKKMISLNNNNNSNVQFIKGSSTKDYYQKINRKIKN